MSLKFLSLSSIVIATLITVSPVSASFFDKASVSGLELSEEKIRSEIMEEFARWEGVRYRLGGTTMRGIDCSSLMQKILHAAFDEKPEIRLPRTTAQQIREGIKAPRYDLRPGDLVFFRIDSGRHVGVYIGDEQFIHASTSKGVIISTLENRYWDQRFTSARRIIS